MTAIAAVKENGVVYMGGDSASSSSSYIEKIAFSKVFKRGEFLFGYTTSFRMGQLLKFKLKLPKVKKDEVINKEEFLVDKFIPKVKKCFEENGFGKATTSDDHEGGTFLLGFQGELFRFQSDFSIVTIKENYNACGGGREFLLGSLYSTKYTNKNARERIHIALNAATEFCPSVTGPFTVISSEDELK